MLIPIILIIVSIVVLYYGAEFSLDSSEKVGKILGLSPLVIGMVLVGFGTSLPELFVGHIASSQGKYEIAIGSLVGSNIANMFLVLGGSGILAKLSIQSNSIREHLWIHLLLGIVLSVVLFYQKINYFSMMALFAVVCVYLFFIYKDMNKNYELHKTERHLVGNPAKLMMKLLIGFIMLYIGGELLVKGGTDFCAALGVSEYIISAIFIAFGTSFPELVTSILAAYKKKDTDLIVGNIIGSNLFNCSLILGSLGMYDFTIKEQMPIESAGLVLGALYLVFVSYFKNSFFRISGTIFVLSYGATVYYWVNKI